MKIIAVCVILLVLVSKGGYCEETVDLTNIRDRYLWDAETLLKSRDRLKVDLAPPGDHLGQIIVKTQLMLRKIIELDLERGILNSVAWLFMSWHDERWHWEGKHNLPHMRMSADSVWKPDLVLYNNAAEHSSQVEDAKVFINQEGQLSWVPMLNLHSFCEGQKDEYISGDKLNCTLIFGSWVYDDTRLKLELRDPGVDDRCEENPNKYWEVVGVDAKEETMFYSCCEKSFSRLSFTLILKRR